MIQFKDKTTLVLINAEGKTETETFDRGEFVDAKPMNVFNGTCDLKFGDGATTYAPLSCNRFTDLNELMPNIGAPALPRIIFWFGGLFLLVPIWLVVAFDAKDHASGFLWLTVILAAWIVATIKTISRK